MNGLHRVCGRAVVIQFHGLAFGLVYRQETWETGVRRHRKHLGRLIGIDEGLHVEPHEVMMAEESIVETIGLE
ncbi:hypothetical protein, partial [Polaromonas sp. AET17H-212]|uniref:hypothetical protein n=1 Tax=Polaromonas sp. AET17H-212 TaxID=1977061 RepID=UPI001C3EA598